MRVQAMNNIPLKPLTFLANKVQQEVAKEIEFYPTKAIIEANMTIEKLTTISAHNFLY